MRILNLSAILVLSSACAYHDSEVPDKGAVTHRFENQGDRVRFDQTWNAVRDGIRLIMTYDANGKRFVGTAENLTEGTLAGVRVEVDIENGKKLGPTRPQDLAPGATLEVDLPAGRPTFTWWSTRAKYGSEEPESGEEGGD